MSNGLNPAQNDAVSTLAGPLLVLAGAGTGKTRVVTFRIANLIRNGVAADRILAVTFTNKAAGEMQERIAELLGIPKRPSKSDKRPRPTIGTFHSQCVRILRQHADKLAYPKKFAIYDRSDQESIARSVLRELRLPTAALKPGDLLAIISQWKNNSVHPDAAVHQASTDKEHLAAAGYRRYQNALKACGAMDFDDLLLNTEVLFTEQEEVRAAEASKFDHILVDEYQDTNGSQYRIIKALASLHRNLCVVGDDDQSIYGWRGADVRHILNFKNDWTDAKVVRLESNYRSTGSILEMANRLIQFNTIRHDKSLKPARPAGKRPRISQFKDETEEALKVVGEIGRMIELNRYQPGEIAILFRTKEQPRLFEQELRKANLPYVMMGSQSFFDRREVRDIIAFLKWIEQPDDEVSLLRIANTPPRGLGQTTIKHLMEAAVKHGEPVWRIMCDPNVASGLSSAARRGIDDLKGILADVRTRARDDGLTEAVNTLVTRTRYFDEIRTRYNEPEECEARIASVGEVVNAVDAYADRANEPSLTEFLAEIALSGRETGSEKDRAAQANAIWLLTMHAAKGLEFPVVYMVGMEDGILPHHRSTKGDEDSIAEERRLCYVGITRAQEELTLSMALTRRKWGKPVPTTPSRFLYEIIGRAENPNQYRKR
ncbi:MAG: UvrD-helicase domain-containing protein [Pirellulaceae bacterium]